MGTMKIERALLSAWRKDGVAEFGRFLAARGVEILSTGGTAKCLRDAGVPVRDVADVTGFPEMLDGRVKTLHPRVHGGLLYRRDLPAHEATARGHGIPRIDLVLVDLYPFEEAAAKPGARREDVIEMIDIGGPAMIRSASKNHDAVVVVVDVDDLSLVRAEIEGSDGGTSLAFRKRMAAKAFRRTASYDAAIAAWMTEERFPERLVVPLVRKEVCRYGENPHQEGAVYLVSDGGAASVAHARQLSGKELSYNNYLDAAAALDVVHGFAAPAAAIIKHKNPCGAAIADDLGTAFSRAYAGDPLSAFGGILAVNRPVTEALAAEIADPKKFFEVIVAPGFEPGALARITTGPKWGKNVRLLETVRPFLAAGAAPGLEFRSIPGGVLVQDADLGGEAEWRCVSRRAPTPAEDSDLRLAWSLCRPVTSNAIVFVKDGTLVGCGAGQMSRVDSVHLAARKAKELAAGAVMASDAFFPFADGILAAADAGIRAVVQPGGSVRDQEVVLAVDGRGLAMVFTGRRHFRH